MKKTLLLLTVSLLFTLLFSCGSDESDELMLAIKEYREAKLTKYREENDSYADYEVDVAFIGDSLTDGYDLQKHYPDVVTVNRGIGGDTTFDLEERLGLSLYDLKPKVAVMLIGANNFSTMFDNYERILKGFVENIPNTRIVLLSLTSMSGEWGKNNQLAAYNNVKIKMLSEQYGFEYIDLYSALMNLKTGEIYPEYTTDGGHLTEAGYAVITAKVTPVIKELLKNP